MKRVKLISLLKYNESFIYKLRTFNNPLNTWLYCTPKEIPGIAQSQIFSKHHRLSHFLRVYNL